MPNLSLFAGNNARNLKILRYGEATLASEVPPILTKVVAQNAEFANGLAPHWRKLPLGQDTHWKNRNEVVLPVLLTFSLSATSSSGEVSPADFGCQTQCVLLTRVYDGHVATRYFMGQSPESGDLYWAEDNRDNYHHCKLPLIFE